MSTKPGPYMLQPWAGEIAETTGLPPTTQMLWGEVAGKHALVSAARLLDSSGAAIPVTAMAASEPVSPEVGARYAVSAAWGAFSAGQIVEYQGNDAWYTTAAPIGGIVARLDAMGTVMQWTGSAWEEYALLDPDDLAALDDVDEALAAMAAAIAEFEALTIPADLDDIADSASRLAMTVEERELLENATPAAIVDTIAMRDSAGRIKASAGIAPDDVATVSQLNGGGPGSGTGVTDILLYGCTSSAATELTADVMAVVLLDTEDWDAESSLLLSSNAVTLPAGSYRAYARGLFATEGDDFLQPVHKLRIAHNDSGDFVELAGEDIPQFPAADADAGKQATLVTAVARFTLATECEVRVQATSSAAGEVSAGASLEITQLQVPVTGGTGGGSTSVGARGIVQLADGAGGFTSDSRFAVDMVAGVGRFARTMRSGQVVAEPSWTDRAATLAAPALTQANYLTCVNNPAPIEGTGDVVLTVTAPTSAPAATNSFAEEFYLTVKNGSASNQLRVVTSGFVADGAIARQLYLWPGDAGTLRYWCVRFDGTTTWWTDGVPMVRDRLEVSWSNIQPNARLPIMSRGTMRIPGWVNDVFFGFAPLGGPSAETVFQLQQRVSGVWTTIFPLTFAPGSAFGLWSAATPIVTSNMLGLLAPAALNGLSELSGGINIGIVRAA